MLVTGQARKHFAIGRVGVAIRTNSHRMRRPGPNGKELRMIDGRTRCRSVGMTAVTRGTCVGIPWNS